MTYTEQLQTYGLWIQTGAIVVSAIGVIATIIWMNRVARRRATLDLVLKEETDQAMVDRRTKFVQLRDAGHLAKWADPSNTAGEEAALVRAILNQYELVAIGIRQGSLDKKMYKDWCRTTLVKEWTSCKPFIVQLRHNQNNPTYFCQYEWLAKKWANREERKHI